MDAKLKAYIYRNAEKNFADKAPAVDTRFPRKLYIEPTSFCNLNCEMCFRKAWINESFGNIKLETVISVMNEKIFLDHVETVFFGGMGEPLIHPDIMRMISAAKERGKRVEIITNGTSLIPKKVEQLVSLGVDKVWVSIDSFDPEGYEKIQVGSSFGTVVKNLEGFNEARKGSSTKLGLTFVVMKSNILQLTEFEHFADFILADDVNISNMIPNTLDMERETLAYQTMDEDYIHPYYYDKENTMVAMFRMTEDDLAENPGIEKLLDKYRALLWRGKPLLRKENSCRFIEDGTSFIRWDGEVCPCMGMLHSAHTCLHGVVRTVMAHSFGNVCEASFESIWNSAAYSHYRERVAAFNYAPCTTCGGCARREGNADDCISSDGPVCSACLWGQGVSRCP